jgi:hypothetical protein
MKKYFISFFALTNFAFANNNYGAADSLASIIMTIIDVAIFMWVTIAILAGLATIIDSLCESIGKLWNTVNDFGKAIIFGIPLFVLSTTIFYFIEWHLIPLIIDYWQVVIIGGSIIFYLSTWCTGFEKDCGKYTIVSRIISTLPFIPIIILCWCIKNVFCKLFLKYYRVTNLIKIWNPYIKEKFDLPANREERTAAFRYVIQSQNPKTVSENIEKIIFKLYYAGYNLPSIVAYIKTIGTNLNAVDVMNSLLKNNIITNLNFGTKKFTQNEINEIIKTGGYVN